MKRLHNPFYRYIEYNYNKQVPGEPLAVFRIAIGCILLAEVCQLIVFRHLYFDSKPYVEQFAMPVLPFFLLWIVAIVGVILGWRTRLFNIINYFCTVLMFGFVFGRWTGYTFEYHIDTLFLSITSAMLFMQVGKAWSVDAYICKRKFILGQTKKAPLTTVSNLNYIFLTLVPGLIYLDTVFYKLASPMWMSGLGVWLPASLPWASWLNVSAMLNQEFLVRASGYLVILFEATFLLQLRYKKLIPYYLIIGIGLHLGIFLAFPIPWFALQMIAVYLGLIPFEFYRRISRLIGMPMRSQYVRVHNGEQAKEDKIRIRWLTFAALFLIGSEVIIMQQAVVHAGLYSQPIAHVANKISIRYSYILFPFTGFQNHPVFMDNHFQGYEHIAAIRYIDNSGSGTFLPIINEFGQAGWYNSGRNWANWSFRVNNMTFDHEMFAGGVKRYLYFWSHAQGIDYQTAQFEILAKELVVSYEWKKDHLQMMMNAPWQHAGTIKYTNGDFVVSIDSSILPDEKS